MRRVAIALLALSACAYDVDDPTPVPKPKPALDAAIHPCAAELAHRAAGGFWCSLDGVSIEPVFARDGCRVCYLTICDPPSRYVRVECEVLP